MTTAPAFADGLDALLGAVDGERMTAVVATLAGPAFTGRRVGSPGGAAARGWLAGRLADAQADVSVEPFPVRSVPEVYAEPIVTWHDGDTTRHLTFGRDVAVHPASVERSSPVGGELAVAGHGDPTGRWLLVPAAMSLAEAYGHADHATGLLLGRNVDADGWQYTMLASADPGSLPVLVLERGVHATLLGAAEQGAGRMEGSAPIRRVDVSAANVHARWRTAAAGHPDVLLTAHYDGVGDHPGLRQPAAADNASGVAVVLEAARILAPALPGGSGLAIALLDAEESGALGSAQHAARLRHDGAAPLVINVDGAGHLHQAAAVEAGGPAHRLLAALDQAGRRTGVPLVAGPVASDNRRYAATGLSAIGIGAGMAGYHSPADIAERVKSSTLVAIARLVVATCWLAAASPVSFHR